MNITAIYAQMSTQADTIVALTQGISAEQAGWKPDPDAWSMLEVINHLLDEEREDFRVRLGLILYHTDQPWPPIDPQGWVTSRHYNERDFEESVRLFSAERQNSLNWLRSMPKPDWQTTVTAPWGSIAAGDMLAAWVAHDLLHIRQLIELHWAYTIQALQPFSTQYAGDW
jgi:hypothetical protein